MILGGYCEMQITPVGHKHDRNTRRVILESACGNGSRNLENKYESVISFAAPADDETRAAATARRLVIDIYSNCVLRKFITHRLILRTRGIPFRKLCNRCNHYSLALYVVLLGNKTLLPNFITLHCVNKWYVEWHNWRLSDIRWFLPLIFFSRFGIFNRY